MCLCLNATVAVFGRSVTPAPTTHNTHQNPSVRDKWTVVTHYFSLFTVSTMDTCTAAGPFLKDPSFQLSVVRPASAHPSYVMCTVVRLKKPWQASWHTLVFP